MDKNNLSAISKKGRFLILAYDHGMEHGIANFDKDNINPEKILALANSGYFTGIALQKGIAERYYQPDRHKVPLIIKLNGKTNLLEEEPYSPQLCQVDEAVSLGAKAVGYTVYVGSRHEKKMMSQFAKIGREADQAGIPLIGWMYPRGQAVKGKEYSREILSYAARLALEMGAEVAKLPYSGDPESFSWVIRAAGRVKVTVQGGPRTNQKDFFGLTKEIMASGADGLIVGRNVWQADDPIKIAKRLNEIV
ncbi:MAG: aldolase, partial [Candidatus Shapirobacteria bacterium]|nr:aldolase [Candidatus Shapirobacteria bacterium]MDD5073864.1 aldolase [Candidatus Shapirobacteria bacterium]MDD5481741.1 aldolase [Candidatus Shapirobacteria bacterium]